MKKTTAFITLLLCGVSSQAWAQAAAPDDQQSAAQAQTESGIADIVVTATRREARLQDVPVAVSAVTSDSLTSSGVANVRDLTFAVPGLNGARTYAVFQPNIRGVGTTGISPGDEANVATYVDGIYQPNAVGNIVDFGEVDRIEVLRGPQGTLFGRNATGGLINIITPDPSFTASGRVGVQYSGVAGEDAIQARAYVTTPLSETIAVNINTIYSRTDGYIHDIVSDKKIGKSEAFNVRGKILFEPSDRFKSILTVAYADQRGGNGNIIAPLRRNSRANLIPGTVLPTEPNDVALNIEPRITIRQFTATLRNSLDLGGVRIETSSGYLDDKVNMDTDADASPVFFGVNRPRLPTKSWNHELRILSQGDSRLQWILGGYYFNLKSRTYTALERGVAATNYSTFTTSILDGRVRTESLSAFGELTYSLTDELKIIGGLRYTDETRNFTQAFNGATVVTPQSTSSDKITYRVTGQYFFAPRSNIYVTYSTGFKSGVYDSYGFSSDPVLPETIKALEVGLKSDPLPWLRVNLSAFHYKYDNLQVNARDDSILQYKLLNAGKAKIQGIDMELQARLSSRLTFSANGSLLDAKYSSFPNAQTFVPIVGPGGAYVGNNIVAADVSGNDMIRAPKYTYSLNATWTQPVSSGEVAFNASLFGSAKVSQDFTGRLTQPAFARLNGQISWKSENDAWAVTLFGTNLTNKTILQQATPTPDGDLVTYERPREIGVRLERRF